jgi:hypothetical protein
VNSFDAFTLFWCASVALIVVVHVAWAINDLKRGSARLHFWGFGERVSREDEPFEFWIAVGSKLIVLPVGVFMIWFAMDMFNR